MSAQPGQPSDSHLHLDPAIHPKDSGNLLVSTEIDACQRALALLANLQCHQAGMSRSAALALERAVFCEAFDHPGPGLRIRRFLDKG
jgi:hypothetical protein